LWLTAPECFTFLKHPSSTESIHFPKDYLYNISSSEPPHLLQNHSISLRIVVVVVVIVIVVLVVVVVVVLVVLVVVVSRI
jgi:hypothetical protein